MSPITDATGLALADTASGNSARVVRGASNITPDGFRFDGNTTIAAGAGAAVNSTAGLNLVLSFTPESDAAPGTLVHLSDAGKAPTSALQLVYNTNHTLSVLTHTPSFGNGTFTTDTPYDLFVKHTVHVICSPGLVGCFVRPSN